MKASLPWKKSPPRMYAIRQGVWWPKPHMKVRPISLAALWHHSAVSQAFRRTQWSRGWMKARRKGIKRSHRHKKSANVPNSYYLEHLPRLPSAIPLYRRSWTVRLLAATEEGAAEKLRGSNATCRLYKHLKFFQPFLTSSCIAPQQYANSNNSQFCHCKR